MANETSLSLSIFSRNANQHLAPEHGDYDPILRKWYCSRWLSQQEWEDIHNYLIAEDSDESSDTVKKN
jgi:hypothetical protein